MASTIIGRDMPSTAVEKKQEGATEKEAPKPARTTAKKTTKK